MAFVVEDGTRKADANSYNSEAEFRAHHADRGVDVTAMTQAEVEACLVNGTDYLDKRFGRRYRGYRASKAQALEWPRTSAFDDDDYSLDGVPRQLKLALNEYGLIAHQLGGQLAPVPGNEFTTVDPATGDVTTQAVSGKTEKVGPITEATQYGTSASFNRPMTSSGNLIQKIPEYPQADLWVEEIIVSSVSRDVRRG